HQEDIVERQAASIRDDKRVFQPVARIGNSFPIRTCCTYEIYKFSTFIEMTSRCAHRDNRCCILTQGDARGRGHSSSGDINNVNSTALSKISKILRRYRVPSGKRRLFSRV